MDQLDDLLKATKYANREPLPEGFEDRVLDKWFDAQPEKKNRYTVFLYAVAACLVAFTCMNVLSLYVLEQPADELSSDTNTAIHISSETEFAEAYGLAERTSYYTLNK